MVTSFTSINESIDVVDVIKTIVDDMRHPIHLH